MNNTAMHDERWSEAELAYLRQNWNVKDKHDIADKLKRTAEAVRFMAHKIGLTTRCPYRENRRAAMLARRAQIKELHGTMSNAEIAKHLGIDYRLLWKDLAVLGLLVPFTPRPDHLKQAVRKWYRIKSAREIGAELGVTRNVVIGTARDLGLQRSKGVRA